MKKTTETFALIITIVMVVGMTGAANATLIEADLDAVGDGLLTQDTDTGFEWLDLTETAGHSIRSVVVDDALGFISQGFHLADQLEVDTLFQHAGLSNATQEGMPVEAVRNYIALLGNMDFSDTVREVNQGFWLHGSLDEAGPIARTEVHWCPGGACGRIRSSTLLLRGGNTVDFQGVDIGTFLVRGMPSNPVPEPSTMLLFGTGVLGLIGYARRRKKLTQ